MMNEIMLEALNLLLELSKSELKIHRRNNWNVEELRPYVDKVTQIEFIINKHLTK